MKKNLISPKRRDFIKAGATGTCIAMAPGIAAAATPQHTPHRQAEERLPLVLSGRIVDDQQQPVAGARVAIANFFERLDGPSAFTAVSDADGRFMVNGYMIPNTGHRPRPLRVWVRSPGRSAAFDSLVFDNKDRGYEHTRMNVVVDHDTVRSSVNIQLG